MTDTKIGIIGFEIAERAGKLHLPPDTPLVIMTEEGETLTTDNKIHITGPTGDLGRTDYEHPVDTLMILYNPTKTTAEKGDVVNVGLTKNTGVMTGDQVFRIDP